MASEPKVKQLTFVRRWNLQHQVQHYGLIATMGLLIGTGFPIKYAYTGWAKVITSFFGSFDNLLTVHKTAAVGLALLGFYHVFWLLVCYLKGDRSSAMIPSLKDVRDAFQHAAYLVGVTDEAPQYGRYSYLEKFEYLAIFWGMVAMGGSGLALWFPTITTRFVPRWILDALRVVHSNEAFVAMLALFFGHFFWSHFQPDNFPSSPVWYSGKQSLHHFAKEHPLELQERVERGDLPAEALEYLEHARKPEALRPGKRVLAVVELIMYTLIFFWLVFTFVPLLFR